MTYHSDDNDIDSGPKDYAIYKPLQPALAIRAKCRECVNNEYTQITDCTGYPDAPAASGCDLWPYREGGRFDASRGTPKRSRGKAIRTECLRCMGGSKENVKECPSSCCAIWPYRLGRGICQDPSGDIVRSRITVSDAHREANRLNAAKGRKAIRLA